MTPHVQTVLGPVAPDALGFVLPHEHTRCVLWQIPGRWDYWELTGEDDLILPELAHFRELGGTCLVDVTLAAIGRDPERLRRLATASGLLLVMGCGWYRGAYYPAEALVDRRSVEELADILSAEILEGAGGPVSGPGSSARSGPTSHGSPPRRSASSGRSAVLRARPGWP